MEENNPLNEQKEEGELTDNDEDSSTTPMEQKISKRNNDNTDRELTGRSASGDSATGEDNLATVKDADQTNLHEGDCERRHKDTSSSKDQSIDSSDKDITKRKRKQRKRQADSNLNQRQSKPIQTTLSSSRFSNKHRNSIQRTTQRKTTPHNKDSSSSSRPSTLIERFQSKWHRHRPVFNKNRSNTRYSSTVDRPVSPEGDIESTDYIDLLLEYDQLKKELDTLEEDDCVIQDPPTTPKYGKKGKDDKTVRSKTTSTNEQSQSRDSSRESSRRKRNSEWQNKIPKTAFNATQKARYSKEEEERRESQRAQQRLESFRILSLEDPNEQYRRFLKMVNVTPPDDTNKTVLPNSVRSPVKFLGEVVPSVTEHDNYEPVEMDLDSDNEKENNIGNTLQDPRYTWMSDGDDALSAKGLLQPPPPPPPISSNTGNIYNEMPVGVLQYQPMLVPQVLNYNPYQPLMQQYDQDWMYSEQAIYQPPSMPPPMNNAHPPPIVEPDYRRNALSYSDLDMFEATNQRSTVPDKTYNSKKRSLDDNNYKLDSSSEPSSQDNEIPQKKLRSSIVESHNSDDEEEDELRELLLHSLIAKQMDRNVSKNSGQHSPSPAKTEDMPIMIEDEPIIIADSPSPDRVSPVLSINTITSPIQSSSEAPDPLNQSTEHEPYDPTIGQETVHSDIIRLQDVLPKHSAFTALEPKLEIPEYIPTVINRTPVSLIDVVETMTEVPIIAQSSDVSVVLSDPLVPVSSSDSLESESVSFTSPPLSNLTSLHQKSSSIPSDKLKIQIQQTGTVDPSPIKFTDSEDLQLPQHKRVVINLSNDSDDSDNEDGPHSFSQGHSQSHSQKPTKKTTLDQFLREAKLASTPTHGSASGTKTGGSKTGSTSMEQFLREAKLASSTPKYKMAPPPAMGVKLDPKPATPPPPPSVINAAVIDNQKKKLTLLLNQLQNDKSDKDVTRKILVGIRDQVSQHKNVLHSAEMKAFALRKQLAAAERDIEGRKQHVTYLNSQLQDQQEYLDKKIVTCQYLEKQSVALGRQLFGKDYTLDQPARRVVVNEKSVGAKPTLKSSPPNQPKRNVIKKSPKSLSKHNAQTLKEKKIALQALINDRIDRIKKLKAEQLRKKKQKSLHQMKVLRHPKRTPVNKAVKKIVTQDRMELNSGSDTDLEITNLLKKPRRLSLNKPDGLNDSLPLFVRMSSQEDVTNCDIATPKSLTVSLTGNKRVAKEISPPLSENQCVVKKPVVREESAVKPTGSVLSPRELLHLSLQYKSDLQTQYKVILSQAELCTQNQAVFKEKIHQVKNFTHDQLLAPETTTQSVHNHSPHLQPYSSPLLHFKAYRFHPFFRTKEKKSLNSASVTHKLDPTWQLCVYDLNGTCKDENCSSQHLGTALTVSERDILADLVSYHSPIAGLVHNTTFKDYSKLLYDFVDKFQQQNSAMKFSQQCLLLVSNMNDFAKHALPHMTFTQKRRWKLPVHKPQQLPSNIGTLGYTIQSESDLISSDNVSSSVRDNILLADDVRYYMLAKGQDIEDMEAAVIENPNNVALCIKLAYKKLNDYNGSLASKLDEALSVLARGLEENRKSSELWLQYLTLYSKHSDKEQLNTLFEQALQYAPSYHIFYQFLCAQDSFKKCDRVCRDILAFLRQESKSCDQHDPMRRQQISHYVLETCLYKVVLCLNMDNKKSALNTLKSIVYSSKATESAVSRLLTPSDLRMTWICYIHITEFNVLPAQIYDPSNSLPGKIVNKENLTFPWKSCRNQPHAAISKLFSDSINAVKLKQADSTDYDIILPLYKAWIQYDVANQKYEHAITLCTDYLEMNSKSVDMHHMIARVYTEQGDGQKASQHLQATIKDYPMLIELSHDLALHYIAQDDCDEAVSVMEQCIISIYDVDITDHRQCDPDDLYCKLLGLSAPLSVRDVKSRPGFDNEFVVQNKTYLELCYCLLLELQGYFIKACEMYENVLVHTTTNKELQVIWLNYLQCHLRQLVTSASKDHRTTFLRLIRRCLMIVPCKMEIPHHGNTYWLDYRFHNRVIRMLLECVPSQEEPSMSNVHPSTVQQQKAILIKLASVMSHNVNLIISICDLCILDKDWFALQGFTTMGLKEHPQCLPLRKIHLNAINKEAKISFIRGEYHNATCATPMIACLWKNWLLFETIYGSARVVDKIYQRCQELGIMMPHKNALLQTPAT